MRTEMLEYGGTGIHIYNTAIQSVSVFPGVTDKISIQNVRLLALEYIKRYYEDAGLKIFYGWLCEVFPHWVIDEKAPVYDRCLRFINLWNNESGLCSPISYRGIELANKFTRGPVRMKGNSIVFIINKLGGDLKKCVIHEDRKAKGSRGLCTSCYDRSRQLVVNGIVDEETSKEMILSLLQIPSMKGKGAGKFIAEAQYLMETGFSGKDAKIVKCKEAHE